ncbi:hypothetical protein Tco_1140551, partial [Tanacetum coccineum]
MTEKCIWFRLCGEEHVFTLLEFVVILGLYEPNDLKHRLFNIHFKRATTIKEPLMRIVQKILVEAFVHRTRSRKRCQKPNLWLMSMLKEGHFPNVAWILAEYLCKKSSGIKENSEVCRGHYVTKIAKALWYYVDDELDKCSDPIESEEQNHKMFAKELDRVNMRL